MFLYRQRNSFARIDVGKKRREVLIAIESLLILAVIVIALLFITYFVILGFNVLRFDLVRSFVGYIGYVVMGLSIGISLGFGFVIAKRLFGALFPPETSS
jgi:hypothetical protein